MEDGLIDNNEFYYIPLNGTASLTEAFRKAVNNLCLEKDY